MLAKCGFADPDRKDPMHDVACSYIAANAEKLCAQLLRRRIVSVSSKLEEPISKGEGQYKTTVGFVDIVMQPTLWAPGEVYTSSLYDEPDTLTLCRRSGLVRELNDEDLGWTEYACVCHRIVEMRKPIGVEVKWSESSVSDAVRQVCVYREFTSGWLWVLAAPWALNVEQKRALKSQKILYAQLSQENVRRFGEEMRSVPATAEAFL
jgi:hypothetical protein